MPIDSYCQEQVKDVRKDASGVLPVDQAEAETIIEGISRRLIADPPDDMDLHISHERRLGSIAEDYDILLNAIAAYDVNSCGDGWQPWSSIQDNNAYAQVSWNGIEKCTISFRGSDDGTDWYSNIVGGVQTTTFKGQSVPTGFKTEYDKIRNTGTYGSWAWARGSKYCTGGVYVTGHSLGGAMAALHSHDVGSSVQLVTFAAPKAGGKNTMCSNARRYFISATWGADPVPYLPPWGQHSGVGKKLAGYLNWFSRYYQLDDLGCGDQSGGGTNAMQHSSSQYKWYMEQILGLGA